MALGWDTHVRGSMCSVSFGFWLVEGHLDGKMIKAYVLGEEELLRVWI